MEARNRPNTFLLERIAAIALAYIRSYRAPVLTSLITGFLAHTFAFTNKLLNHDEVLCLFGKGDPARSGRWGLMLTDLVFSDISMPWIHGVLTLLLITWASCLIIHILKIQSKLLQALLAGSIVVFPSLTGTLTYMFTASAYALAFFLAVLAVWIFYPPPLHRWRFPLALGCMILSLGIYQAYISIAAVVLILVLIRQLLHEDTVTPVIRKGFLYLFFLIASMVTYFGITLLVNRLMGTSLGEYASSKLGQSIGSFSYQLYKIYYDFMLFFRSGNFHGLTASVFSRRVHMLCLLAAVVLFFVWVFSLSKKNPWRILLLVVLCALLPLGISCMYLITSRSSVHGLVLYSYIAVYILAVLLADVCLPILPSSKLLQMANRFCLQVISLGMAAVIVANIYAANSVYLNLYLRYENTYAFYSSLATQIKTMPEFDETMEIAVIGYYQEPSFYNENFTVKIAGFTGINPDSYSRDAFMEYYLGLSIPFASDDRVAEISASEEFASMPAYPYYGSMKLFGQTLVIKLSDLDT